MIGMFAKRLILSRLLPKTGQSIQYHFNDDGSHQVGWWKKRLLANNRTRFISKTIGGDVVIIDRATGLMWAADGNAAGCFNGLTTLWDTAIDYASGLDFAGFTDWRLPNVKELASILDYGRSNPAIDTNFFTNVNLEWYFTATTLNSITTSAWIISFLDGLYSYTVKTNPQLLRCVRGGL